MEPVYPVLSPTYTPKKIIHGANLEEALNIVGLGRHQWAFAIITGLAFLAAGLQNGITAFILPSMKCDMGLTSSQMGLLNAAFLIGGIGSGLVWGAAVDTIGRRPVMFYGLLADAIITLASAFTPSFVVFLVFRFLNGFVIGGPASVALMHVGELIPQEHRPRILCYTGLTWSVSWVAAAGLAWAVIPLDVSWPVFGDIDFTSWRLLLVLVAAIDFLSATLYLMVFESPKFHMSKGQNELALEVLANVYALNKQVPPSEYPVKSLEPLKNSNENVVNCSNKSIWRPIVVTLKQCRGLLQGPALITTALTSFLWFTNMFGYYGLGLWMPELANRYKVYESQGSNDSTYGISVCELSGFQTEINLDLPSQNETSTSCGGNVDPSVFLSTLISGCILVAGNIVAALLASKLPRLIMPVILMFGAAACVMSLFLVRTSTENLIVSSLFQLCIGTANLVQNALIIDIFPPNVSGLAVCVTIMMGRVGAMISNLVLGQLLDVSCSIPIVMCAVFIAAGGVASMFIPRSYKETTKFPLAVISRSTA